MNPMHRRSFVKTIFISGAVAAGLSSNMAHGQTGPARKRKMTIDLSWGAIGVKANQLQAIELAHRFGFESVAADSGYIASLADDQLQTLVADLKSKGLVWGGAGVTVDFRGSDQSFDKGIRDFPRIAAALKRAGVTRVSTWISPAHAQLTYVQNFRQHAARLRRIAQVLGEHGHRLGLEYVGPKTSWTRQRYPFIHSMAEMKDLIGEIGLDNVGFVLDSWHWYTAGEGAAELKSLTKEQVVAVDLNDAPAGIPLDEQMDNRRELPSATGVIDLKLFLTSLVNIGYDGPVRAEPFNQPLNALDNEEACAATIAAMKKAFALAR